VRRNEDEKRIRPFTAAGFFAFTKNLQLQQEHNAGKNLTLLRKYDILYKVQQVLTKDMRRSGRLPAVCRGISVEYVRFETGRQGMMTQYVSMMHNRVVPGYDGTVPARMRLCLNTESVRNLGIS
jgi:hypothetical protein